MILNDAELLEATCKGPLEALDLGGNQIRRGQAFLEKFIDIFMKQTPCDDIGSVAGGKLKPLINPDIPKRVEAVGVRLRHLGLSQNQLSKEFVANMLDNLHNNTSLTSIDLGCNELYSGDKLDDAFRQLLKNNESLRRIDLHGNKLSNASPLHLGLLENETMLMINLSGNPLVADANSFHFQSIQNKLLQNRLIYRNGIYDVRRQRKIAEKAAKKKVLTARNSSKKKKNDDVPIEVIAEVVTPLGSSKHSNKNASADRQTAEEMSREKSQNVYEKAGHADTSTPALGNAKMRLPIDDEYHIGINTAHTRRESEGVKVITGTRANTIFHDRVIGRMEKLTSPKSIVCAPEQVEVGATSARMNLKIDQSVGESGGDLLLSPSPAGESVGESAFNLEEAARILALTFL